MTRSLLSGMLIFLCSTAASAAEVARATIEMRAQVLANCRLTIPMLDFGIYDPLIANANQPRTAQTDLMLTCTRNAVATIELNRGIYGSNPFSRSLAYADERLQYQLFRDPARTLVWADGLNALRMERSNGTAASTRLTIFGAIPPGQEVAPGEYSDVITATVDF